MAGSAILSIKILTDASNAKRGLDSAATSMDKFKSGLSKAAVPAALVGAAILKFGKDAVDSASRTQQAMGGVEAVFGKNAKTVERWAAGAAQSIGLAKSEYGEACDRDRLAGCRTPASPGHRHKENRGPDPTGGRPRRNVRWHHRRSGRRPLERDERRVRPPRKYGTSLSAAKIAAQQAADGTDKLTGKAAAQAKMMATLKLITEQTAKAHGAAAREQDTYAARTQQFSAEIENLKSDLGTALLPIVAALVDKFAGLAGWMSQNIGLVQIIVEVIGGLVGIILVLNAAMKVAAIVHGPSTLHGWRIRSPWSCSPWSP